MNAPILTTVAKGAYGRLGAALTSPDAANRYALAALLGVLVDPLDDAYLLARDGWAGVFDIEATPRVWLEWVAQAAGVAIPEGTELEIARAMVARPVGWLAGTPYALLAAVKSTLTGSRTVDLVEHHQGDPWRVKLTTYEVETPDRAATEAAARRQLEAGIDLTYELAPGWTFNELADTGISYNELARITADRITRAVPGTTIETLRSWMT